MLSPTRDLQPENDVLHRLTGYMIRGTENTRKYSPYQWLNKTGLGGLTGV